MNMSPCVRNVFSPDYRKGFNVGTFKSASDICPDECHIYSAWGAPFPLIQLGLGWRSPSLVKAVGGVWWGNYQ